MFDDADITITCPKCGAEHVKSIGWLRENHDIACDCGSTLNLDVSGLFSGLNEVEDSLTDFTRNLGKAFE